MDGPEEYHCRILACRLSVWKPGSRRCVLLIPYETVNRGLCTNAAPNSYGRLSEISHFLSPVQVKKLIQN